MNNDTNNFTTEQIKIIKAYIKAVGKYKKHLTREEFKNEGFNRNKVEYHFGSLTNLKKQAKEYNSAAFNNIIDSDLFNPKKFNELKDLAKEYKKFVITCAVTGCDVHDGFYKTIKNYCKINNALLLILPCSDPAHTRDKNKWSLSEKLKDEMIVFSDLGLNSNLFLSTIKTSAKQLDPITGLGRIGSRNGSFIFASPKQRLKLIPTSNVKLPHALMTTGAITKPEYNTEMYMSERTAYLGDNDHIVGGIVVELVDDKFFHFRQIQAESTGHFNDLGVYYTQTETDWQPPEALVLGDWHSGETDSKVKEITFDMIRELKPEVLVVHDLFDGCSICHFDVKKSVNLAVKEAEGKLNLGAELQLVANELNELTKLADKVVIVKSNHDERLEKYLNDSRYINDPQNHLLCLKLAAAFIEGNDPLKWAMENIYKINDPNKVKWLSRDEDYKIARIELGSHGDLGSNGSKGNLKATEGCYGNSVTGHFHNPEILRGAYQVGTSTKLKLCYNRGASNWLHTHCLVGASGNRQLINIINGKWRA